jgi:hypothetical protein
MIGRGDVLAAHILDRSTRDEMDETQISKVAEVLSEWNPLGNEASKVPDLDGYRTEAIDIIATFDLPFIGGSEASRVMNVLNQAFELSLSEKDCAEPARRIALILKQQRQ